MGLPTCLFGYIRGLIRWEGCKGSAMFDGRDQFLINVKPKISPFTSLSVGITHLQKRSKFGFLLMKGKPWYKLCFHIWYTFKYQGQDYIGNWIPGSEIVFYARTPGWRYDFARCRHIFTKGYLNLSFNWD